MALWKLTPINLDHTDWEGSPGYKDPVIVRAPNEDEARQAAINKFWRATNPTPIGEPIRGCSWNNSALVEAVPIEDAPYKAEGPIEVLEPAD